MTDPIVGPHRLQVGDLAFEVNANGSLHHAWWKNLAINLFVGNALEGGPTNLWLRIHGTQGIRVLPLLGPASASRFFLDGTGFEAIGECDDVHWRVRLVLAAGEPAWFWHVQLHNRGINGKTMDLLHAQDVALADYGHVRLNEHYVSHYIDLSPLEHAKHGWVLAARQNLAQAEQHPWLLLGSLRWGIGFATDASQLSEGKVAAGLGQHRLQHEHAALALQDAPLILQPDECTTLGFFARFVPHHPSPTTASDLAFVAATLSLPEAVPNWAAQSPATCEAATTLFSSAPDLPAKDLATAELDTLFGPERRHEERITGELLSFFCGHDTHVVLAAKERRVMRPHGHIVRSGGHLTPDEQGLTSTVWMNGVFHSMLCQGHVSINRSLSTVRSYLGLLRSQGQRIFVRLQGRWWRLAVPSAFAMTPQGARWCYRHANGLFEVQVQAGAAAHEMTLRCHVLQGEPLALRVSHHLAFGGDDGSALLPVPWQFDRHAVFVALPVGSSLAERFNSGGLHIQPLPGSSFAAVAGDEALFTDGRTRQHPYLCIDGVAGPEWGLVLRMSLVSSLNTPAQEALAPMSWQPPPNSRLADDVARLADIVPWYQHNALVHYLSPRGLEQYSGGGWGTRDVCQGPLEMLLALGHREAARDLLLRVFSAQNPDGDWPQWFMFFERDQALRAGDSHGDVVYWPLLALARYLIATADDGLLDTALPYHGGEAVHSVWSHVQRALQVIHRRRIAHTELAAYGHGDWNDALQPADPALREHLCSAWTVTLHHQVLTTLAQALQGSLWQDEATLFTAQARAVQDDFQRLLVRDGVVTGYAHFAPAEVLAHPTLLLHPSDHSTGLRYSLLPMIHAIINNLFSAEQAHAHLALIQRHLMGPDGARLFDRPMAYRGGPQRLFQRAESSAYFGREIGVMYSHAHLRFAEALAHLGEADKLFEAVAKANPIGLQRWVPSAALRQANCYFSSSDAAFSDRYQASRDYDQIAAGTVQLEGGWRIYSSGPGLALNLIVRGLLGLGLEARALVLDPVLPSALNGLVVTLTLQPYLLRVTYDVGPRGHGVLAAQLNGQALALSRRPNPYRLGAAAIDLQAVQAALRPEGNDLRISLG